MPGPGHSGARMCRNQLGRIVPRPHFPHFSNLMHLKELSKWQQGCTFYKSGIIHHHLTMGVMWCHKFLTWSLAVNQTWAEKFDQGLPFQYMLILFSRSLQLTLTSGSTLSLSSEPGAFLWQNRSKWPKMQMADFNVQTYRYMFIYTII